MQHFMPSALPASEQDTEDPMSSEVRGTLSQAAAKFGTGHIQGRAHSRCEVLSADRQ